MSNPIYQQMGQQFNGHNVSGLMQRFQQFKQTFTGDPRAQVQQLLNSGRVTQAQFNNAVQIAQQFQRMLGVK